MKSSIILTSKQTLAVATTGVTNYLNDNSLCKLLNGLDIEMPTKEVIFDLNVDENNQSIFDWFEKNERNYDYFIVDDSMIILSALGCCINVGKYRGWEKVITMLKKETLLSGIYARTIIGVFYHMVTDIGLEGNGIILDEDEQEVHGIIPSGTDPAQWTVGYGLSHDDFIKYA